MPAAPVPSSHAAGRTPSPTRTREAVAGWEQLLAALPPEVDVEASARAQGAFRRPRAVRSAETLLRLACSYALRAPSLRLTAGEAVAQRWADLSAVALGKRLRRCRAWLGVLVAALLVPAGGPAGAGRVRLWDASVLRRPGVKGTDWRLHVSWDLAAARIDALELTDASGGETLRRHAACPGDILVADAGLSHRRGVAHVLGQGAQVVVRWAWQTLPLQEADGTPLGPERLAARLVALPAEGIDWAVQMPRAEGAPLPLRLVGCRLPGAAAQRKRERLVRQARKKGRPLPHSSLLLAGWLLVLTSLPAQTWPAERVLALYRLRWQVELAFKRLKGIWQLDLLPRCGAALAQVRLLATLLLALLAQRARPPAVGAALAEAERPLSLGRWEALEHQAVRDAVCGRLTLQQLWACWPRLERHLRDTPRRRPCQAALAIAAARLLQALARASPPHRLLQVA